jgi:predicted  nucleic acid-binding Zn-ribbon protein
MSLRRVQVNNETYWLAIVQDVTKQVYAEQELEKKIAELEALNQVMIDRELSMVELKNKVRELETKLSQSTNG